MLFRSNSFFRPFANQRSGACPRFQPFANRCPGTLLVGGNMPRNWNYYYCFFSSDFPYMYLPVRNTHNPKMVDSVITAYPILVISPSSVLKFLFLPRSLIIIFTSTLIVLQQAFFIRLHNHPCTEHPKPVQNFLPSRGYNLC